MKYVTILSFWFLGFPFMVAQKNCNVYKWEGDVCRYEACVFLEEAPSYFQLRKEYHDIHNQALEICPEYSDAYRAKSVAHLKTGDFITWKQLMDKAVELNPVEHLGYRGWCRFQFFRDYVGAIADIEKLDLLTAHDIGYSQNGMYHLNVAKALCYKMIGENEKAIDTLKKQMGSNLEMIGLYDYLHLGVLYFDAQQFNLAKEAFERQIEEYDCAENRYYLAMVHKALDEIEAYIENLKLAKVLYEKNRTMYDPYTHQIDKIYQMDIEKEYAMFLKAK